MEAPRQPKPPTPPQTPRAPFTPGQNTSGMGQGHEVPDGVKGWSWGAFLLNWIWSLGNKTWIGLLALIPYIGFIMAVILAVKGREWAWQNKKWDSLEHFNRVQRLWSVWAIVVVVGMFVVGVTAAIIIPVIIGMQPQPV